jgi:hypothetical protein
MNKVPGGTGLASQVYDRNSLMNNILGSTGLASQVYDRTEFILTIPEYIMSRGIYAACQIDIAV